MFFKLSLDQDQRFPNTRKITSRYWLNTDEGWSFSYVNNVAVYFKGYAISHKLLDILPDIVDNPTPRYDGNFLMFLVDGEQITITHDSQRGTFLYFDREKDVVHNFPWPGQRIAAAEYITFTCSADMKQNQFNPYGTIDFTPLTFDEGIAALDNILTKKFTDFFPINELPVNVFVTGGADSGVVYTYIKKLGIEHTLLTAECDEFTHFSCQFRGEYRKYWGYNQIHHWRTPALLTTGACGDTTMVRNGPTANPVLMHYGMEMNRDCPTSAYHYHFINRPSIQELLAKHLADEKLAEFVKDWKNLVAWILDVHINDHQHWHLGNTLTFTPLKDIELTKIILRMPKDAIVSQIFDAGISKELMKRYHPPMLEYLGTFKNVPARDNIWKLYKQYV